MPEAVVLNTSDGALRPVYGHKGSVPGDRPSVDDLPDQVRQLGQHSYAHFEVKTFPSAPDDIEMKVLRLFEPAFHLLVKILNLRLSF